MFLNEARLAATLHHPNIAQVYDIGVEERRLLLRDGVRPRRGPRSHVRSQSSEQGVPMSLDAALTLVARAVRGPALRAREGRRRRQAARDRPPRRVAVERARQLRRRGQARRLRHRARARRQADDDAAASRARSRTCRPSSAARDGALDRRSDIFSVGTILYELTTGQLPFTGETEYAVLNQIVNRDVPPPSAIVPDYPPALEQIVLRALARDPTQRYTTALELQGAARGLRAREPAARLAARARAPDGRRCSRRGSRSGITRRRRARSSSSSTSCAR